MRVDTTSYLKHSMRETGTAWPQIFGLKLRENGQNHMYVHVSHKKNFATAPNGPTATMDHSNSNFQRHSFATGYLIMKCMKILCHENPEYTVNQ